MKIKVATEETYVKTLKRHDDGFHAVTIDRREFQCYDGNSNVSKLTKVYNEVDKPLSEHDQMVNNYFAWLEVKPLIVNWIVPSFIIINLVIFLIVTR